VIVGPTASGKTALSLALAERFPLVEIVSADSRQIYAGMDIGTAKPSADELRAIPHHLIDIVTPDTLYSAGRYAVDARAAIDDIIARGGMPLVVGGSGFYVKALFHGLGAPAVDQRVLDDLTERAAREGYDALYDELLRVDPAAAHSPNNRVKLLRALACWHQTGERYSAFEGEEAIGAAPYEPLYIGIAPGRAELYERINQRVLTMMRQGLVAETEELLRRGYDADSPGMKTVGYAEVIRYLAGDLAYDAAVALIQQSTRRYAKRQMTWFRRVEGVRWLGAPGIDEAVQVIGERERG
jgi:tRNA dimethylallyltransferase